MSRQNTHTADLLRKIFSGEQGKRVSGDPAIDPKPRWIATTMTPPTEVWAKLMSVLA